MVKIIRKCRKIEQALTQFRNKQHCQYFKIKVCPAPAKHQRQTGSGQQQPQFRPEFPDPAAGKKFGNIQIKRKVGLIPDRQNIMMPEPDGKQQAQPERQKQRIQHITPENPAAAKQVQRNGSQQNQCENNFLQKHKRCPKQQHGQAQRPEFLLLQIAEIIIQSGKKRSHHKIVGTKVDNRHQHIGRKGNRGGNHSPSFAG